MKHNDVPNIQTLSPQDYANTFNVYEDDTNGMYFYDLHRTVNIPGQLDSSVYNLYTILAEDTLPLIAWKNYQNVKMWWIICCANNIQNPFQELIPGETLKILTPNIVRGILNTIRRG